MEKLEKFYVQKGEERTNTKRLGGQKHKNED